MEDNNNAVPYIVYEGALARAERITLRLTVVIIILISIIFASNAIWLYYESQFESYTYQQDGEGTNSINTGMMRDLNLNYEPEAEGETP